MANVEKDVIKLVDEYKNSIEIARNGIAGYRNTQSKTSGIDVRKNVENAINILCDRIDTLERMIRNLEALLMTIRYGIDE